MASDITICNLALARLGDEATVASISPPEGSAQAEHCERFYPIARDTLLAMHEWGFATRCVALAPLASNGPQAWRFSYALPADNIRPVSVLSPSPPNIPQRYAAEGGNILTDQAGALLRYVWRATDVSRFPPLFVDALAWLLASYLAGVVLKGDAGAAMSKSCLQFFSAMADRAMQSDANGQHAADHFVPSGIAAR